MDIWPSPSRRQNDKRDQRDQRSETDFCMEIASESDFFGLWAEAVVKCCLFWPGHA